LIELHMSAAGLAGAPCREVARFVRIAVLARKTEVHMPASVAWIVRMGKSNGKGPEPALRQPSAFADKLIERCVQR
jgi:hypothetical protein